MATPRGVRELAWTLALALVYFAAAKLGLSLAVVHASATAVWPPTGVAIAATILLGRIALPGIYAGAFLANLTTSGAWAPSLGIAAGNTLEALVGALLIMRFARGRAAMDSPRDIFVFGVIVAAVAAPLSATIGVLTLIAGGLASADGASAIWLTWWMGDATGALVFAAPILLWANRPRLGWQPRQAIEAAVVLVGSLAAAVAIFGTSGVQPLRANLPLGFATIPIVLYAAFRFGAREAATLSVAISAIAIDGTRLGYGPFAVGSPNQALLFVQGYVAVITLLAVLTGTLVQASRRTEEQLARAVAERTADLTLAQSIAKLASWTYDPQEDRLVMSDELPRLYGMARERFPTRFEEIAALTIEEDRAASRDAVAAALRDVTEFEFDYRVRLADGEIRTLHAHGQVTRDDGRVLARGTTQDVTALRASEARLRAFLEAAPDAIVVTDADGRITLVNREAERIFGYARDEMLGRRVEMLIPAAARAAHPKHREGYFAEPRARPMGMGLDLRALRKDGTEFPVEISLSPIQTSEGVRVMSAIRDTTFQQRALRMEREQFVTKKLVRRLLRHERIAGGSSTLRRDLGRQMADEAACADIAEYVEAFRAMGLGVLDVVSRQGERYEIAGDELLEVTPGYHATTCHLTLGFLEGAVARLSEGDALGAETACQSQGQKRCTFVVVARPRKA